VQPVGLFRWCKRYVKQALRGLFFFPLRAGAVMWSTGSAAQGRLGRRGLQVGCTALSADISIVALQAAGGEAPWVVVAAWALAGLGIGLSSSGWEPASPTGIRHLAVSPPLAS
jgi:hypothetical protein